MNLTRKQLLFLRQLSKYLLPMPQNKKEWFASQIYVDEINNIIYDVEQWSDYLKLKNKFPYEDYDFIKKIKMGKKRIRKIRYHLWYIF